jgi:hypothetical protein
MEKSGFGIMVSFGTSAKRRDKAAISMWGETMLQRMLLTWLCGSLAAAAWGQPVVKVEGVTSTQAVLSYEAPDNAACTVKVSESDTLSPVVHDVNPELFSGSNQDLGRPATVVNGQYRTVTIGARTSEKASNGWLYSRALQTFTQHYYSVECSSGTATGTFTTANIPLGNTFPEPPPFNADGFGNYAWPTIDWADPSKTYIDPMTGVLAKMAYPVPAQQGNSRWGSDNGEYAFAHAIDSNGAWTNIDNLLNTSTSGPFATYSGSNHDPVFLAFPEIYGSTNVSGWGSPVQLDDVRLKLYGFGSGSSTEDRTVLACLSSDSGQTCLSSELELVLPTGAGTVSAPSNYPHLQFSGWGLARYLRKSEIGIQAGKVDVSGNVVTLTSTDATSQFFSTGWSSGTKIYIQGSAPTCPGDLCTITEVRSATQLTIQQTLGTLSGANYRGASFGVRIRKKTATGTVDLASSFAYAWSYGAAMPLNGVADFCSKLTTTVSYAADGLTPITPVEGRMCVLRASSYFGTSMLVLLIESTGEVRTLSDFYFSTGAAGEWRSGSAQVPYGSFSPTDPLTVYTTFADNSGGCTGCTALYKVTYDAETGKFRNWTGSNYNYISRPSDYLTWVNLTPYAQNKGITQQIAAAIQTNPFYDSSMGTNADYAGIVGNYALFSLGFGGGQDAPCFVMRFSLTDGTLAQIADTLGGSSPTGRWAGCHSIQTMGAGNWNMILASLLNKQNSSAAFGGPYEVRQVSEVYKAGDWSTNTAISTGDFNACTPGTPFEAEGAQGNNCLKIRITGEPCSAYATSMEKQKYPCPWDANRSMPQTLQPGDYLWVINPDRYFDGKNEKMRVISKTDIGSGAYELEVIRMATCRGVTYYDDDTKRTHANGWTFVMSGSGLCAGNGWWIDATDSSKRWYAEDSVLSGGHGTLGSGVTPDQFTMLVAGTASRYNLPLFEQFGRPPMYVQQHGLSQFGGLKRTSGMDVQSYLNKGQWVAPASEQVWALDLRHYNPSTGVGGESPSGIWNQTYSLVSGTTQVYKIDNAGVYGKVLPYLSWAGPNLLKDMSGPNSVITDADAWRFCVALKAGECRSGSNVNDTFVNVPKASISTTCVVNQHSRNYPCFTNGYWFGAWITQSDISRDDASYVNGRRLSMGFTGPGRQYHFTNAHTTPSGKWAFFGPGWIDGVRPEVMMLKLPPWPNAQQDGTRSGFVPVQVDLQPNEQYSKARIRFGYAENGPVDGFFCTSRQEACVTDNQLTPFAYAQSETLTPAECQGGCSISVPAIPGRILYYREERLTSDGGSVYQGPIKVRAVP